MFCLCNDYQNWLFENCNCNLDMPVLRGQFGTSLLSIITSCRKNNFNIWELGVCPVGLCCLVMSFGKCYMLTFTMIQSQKMKREPCIPSQLYSSFVDLSWSTRDSSLQEIQKETATEMQHGLEDFTQTLKENLGEAAERKETLEQEKEMLEHHHLNGSAEKKAAHLSSECGKLSDLDVRYYNCCFLVGI